MSEGGCWASPPSALQRTIVGFTWSTARAMCCWRRLWSQRACMPSCSMGSSTTPCTCTCNTAIPVWHSHTRVQKFQTWKQRELCAGISRQQSGHNERPNCRSGRLMRLLMFCVWRPKRGSDTIKRSLLLRFMVTSIYCATDEDMCSGVPAEWCRHAAALVFSAAPAHPHCLQSSLPLSVRIRVFPATISCDVHRCHSTGRHVPHAICSCPHPW